MATFEWMIALSPGGNTETPQFDGPKDAPFWGLYTSYPAGNYWADWRMSRCNGDMTYAAAVELARVLGFEGDPIGG
jgi:hypothetical protein